MPLIERLFFSNISILAMFFSVVVFLLWSFVPVLGYLLAKLLKANGTLNKYFLFAFGAGAGLIENGLYYFDILTYDENFLVTFSMCMLFFICAYISIDKTKTCFAKAS
ncbi:hypothetical protein RI844_07735 [Thalassotalea fonticola]|uniref:Uncharacterized protein n=1 Tax=Thalassotalea fonticola TaxID=3065649 RepID=A0ABZ0GTH1_9GAMM|nr:hypothetical protein RI844_07735 [Colwelliaceae bacterium S1-1]